MFIINDTIILGTVESKPNRCQTGLKSMPNKRIQPKGPFLANVPLQHMVQNYEDTEIKEINRKPNGSRGVCLYFCMKNILLFPFNL